MTEMWRKDWRDIMEILEGKNRRRQLITIIIPCYNESEGLPVFMQEMTSIMKRMQDQDFEIIFINDGSSDDTLSVIKNLSEQDNRVNTQMPSQPQTASQRKKFVLKIY